jgi:hypothetical protein
MAAGAAKTIVEVEMAERGVKVVAPEEADYAPAEPDALEVRGRTSCLAADFGDFVVPAWRSVTLVAGCRLLLGSFWIGTLGESLIGGADQGQGHNCERCECTEAGGYFHRNHGYELRCLLMLTAPMTIEKGPECGAL